MPKLLKTISNIPLPDSFRLSGQEWKEMLGSADRERIGKHLSLLLLDFQSMPTFIQREVRKALTMFIRTRRPLPLEIAELPPFSLDDSPPDWDQLQIGDIIFTRPNPAIFQGFLWAMHYSHVGIYATEGMVMEANMDKGVRLCPLEKWKKSKAHMGFARLSPENIALLRAPIETVMADAAECWCDRGFKYNFAMWEEAGSVPGRFYCSELIWQIFFDAGVDLRENPKAEIYVNWIKHTFGDWAAKAIAEPAIAPDELALSEMLNFYSVGKNG